MVCVEEESGGVMESCNKGLFLVANFGEKTLQKVSKKWWKPKIKLELNKPNKVGKGLSLVYVQGLFDL